MNRDLTVAGRVLVKVGDKFESRLVKIDKYAIIILNTRLLITN